MYEPEAVAVPQHAPETQTFIILFILILILLIFIIQSDIGNTPQSNWRLITHNKYCNQSPQQMENIVCIIVFLLSKLSSAYNITSQELSV